MRVCAIVLDFGGAKRTSNGLRSLQCQHLATIYVVDNNTITVDSVALVDELRDFSEPALPKPIRILIKSVANLGFARGVNMTIH